MLHEVKTEKPVYAYGTESSAVNKTGDWRFLTPERVPGLAPCRQGCLLDGEVPVWLEAVKREQWEEAWQIISRYNPFPSLTGYTCFHPCTDNCNREQLDSGLDIPAVEKAVGLWRLDQYRGAKKKELLKDKIAVVGSGPAGLSCAYYLNQVGYRVTVYEKADQIGGMLALGIPEYRLPRSILTKELNLLKNEGIEFVTGCAIGEDLLLNDLYSKYKEVFLAPGAWKSRKAGIPGEESSGAWNALDFLSEFNRGAQPEIKDPVIVIGGGNAAIDSARSALRMNGVNHVTLFYRRSRAEMPAYQPEVEAAETEGVELIFNALPRKIITDDIRISGIEFNYSKTNREGLVVDESTSFKKPCGTVIMALGQEHDSSIFSGLEKEASFYAGGDLVTGPATVSEAIKAGRIAAQTMIARLEHLPEPELCLPTEDPISFEDLHLEASVNLEIKNRQELPEAEASRCLGCGTCNSCGICYIFCPDMAIDIVEGRYELNMDYCKGCGICYRECPSRALVMKGGR
ncbi:MAG: FAD-dependent oxidoreductase [Bacillota bacterium]